MASTFAPTAIALALDAITIDRVSLHSGDPGTTGANYITAAGRQSATFGAASGGERLMSGDVAFTGMSAGQAVTHWGAWLNAGTVFRCGNVVTGDQAANASGEYTLKGTTTKLSASAI